MRCPLPPCCILHFSSLTLTHTLSPSIQTSGPFFLLCLLLYRLLPSIQLCCPSSFLPLHSLGHSSSLFSAVHLVPHLLARAQWAQSGKHTQDNYMYWFSNTCNSENLPLELLGVNWQFFPLSINISAENTAVVSKIPACFLHHPSFLLWMIITRQVSHRMWHCLG